MNSALHASEHVSFCVWCAGVTSFEVDLESKKVVVIGDITPYEVLASISKVMKFAELWVAPNSQGC